MSSGQNNMSDIIPIIDAHCHVFPDQIAEKSKFAVKDFYEMPMYTTGNTANLDNERKRIVQIGERKYRIIKQLISAPAVTPHQSESINQFISSLVKQDNSLIGFGTVHPDGENSIEQLSEFKKLGLCGLKLHSDFQKFNIDDKKAYPIYEESARLGLPILFHMGDRKFDYSHPRRLQKVLSDIPGLRVIAAHTGGYSHWEEAIDILEPSDRLYFDISSTLQFIEGSLLKDFLDKFGEAHFFFGSDFPMWDPFNELQRLLSFGFSEKTNKALLINNFLNFFQ